MTVERMPVARSADHGKRTGMHAFLHLLQWPAMGISLFGTWWVGDTERRHRHIGFAVLMASNALWFIWAVTDHAWALLVMQAAFLLLNGRGFYDSVKGRARG